MIAVSDDGQTVVPLLGGHHGANQLAKKIVDVLGGMAAVTTSGDVRLGVSLDEPPLGYRLADPARAKSVIAGLLAGASVSVKGPKIFDLPYLEDGEFQISVSEAPIEAREKELVYHAQHYALGVGCARGCSPDELENLARDSLANADISPEAVAAIGSLDLKADENAVRMLAKTLNCLLYTSPSPRDA